ncbi:hypothetical protein LLG95_03640 [bacterium]|nr:hypothetical protein [bacterium]
MRRPFHFISGVILLAGLLLQGCALAWWNPAITASVKDPRLIRSATESLNGESPQSCIVVSYSTGRKYSGYFLDAQVFYVIPNDGLIRIDIPPDRPQRLKDIISDVSGNRQWIDSVGKMKFSKTMYKRGMKYKTTDFAHNSFPISIENTNVTLIAYWSTNDEQNFKMFRQLIPFKDRDLLIDSSVHFVLVPSTQRRFLGEYLKSDMLVLVNAPVCLALEVLILPGYLMDFLTAPIQ